LTNVLNKKNGGDFHASLDLEVLRSSITLLYGAGKGFELGAELPFYFVWRGLLDDTILDVEEFIGARSFRMKSSQFKFDYQLSKGGRTFFAGRENSLGVGDISLWIKRSIIAADHGDTLSLPSLSVRGGLKAPTGDSSRALGSGEWDFSVGLLIEKHLWRFSFYFDADLIFPGNPFKEVGLDAEPFYTLVWSWEIKATRGLSFNLQMDMVEKPFRNVNFDFLDNRIFNVLFGVSYATKRGVIIRAGIVEDIFASEQESADVSILISLAKRF